MTCPTQRGKKKSADIHWGGRRGFLLPKTGERVHEFLNAKRGGKTNRGNFSSTKKKNRLSCCIRKGEGPGSDQSNAGRNSGRRTSDMRGKHVKNVGRGEKPAAGEGREKKKNRGAWLDPSMNPEL